MIWGKIKIALAAAMTAAIAFLYALLQKEKRERIEDELGDEQAAREVEAQAHREMIDGMQKENQIREEDDSDIRPGRFS